MRFEILVRRTPMTMGERKELDFISLKVTATPFDFSLIKKDYEIINADKTEKGYKLLIEAKSKKLQTVLIEAPDTARFIGQDFMSVICKERKVKAKETIASKPPVKAKAKPAAKSNSK